MNKAQENYPLFSTFHFWLTLQWHDNRLKLFMYRDTFTRSHQCFSFSVLFTCTWSDTSRSMSLVSKLQFANLDKKRNSFDILHINSGTRYHGKSIFSDRADWCPVKCRLMSTPSRSMYLPCLPLPTLREMWQVGWEKDPSTMEFITKCESKTLIKSLIAGPAGM